MVESIRLHVWTMRLAFIFVALFLIFLRLLPLNTETPLWTGPDLLLALTLAFAVRRPEYLPSLHVAVIFLLEDLLLQRPPGLFALMVLIGSETLKSRSRALHEQNFLMEWLSVSASLFGILFVYRFVLAVLLVPQAPLGLAIMQFMFTLLAYPFVVGAAHIVVGLRKATPAEMDGMGRSQ